MLPVIVLLGRPNVGKSTLFNALTRTRNALVADLPGLTRDCQYGIGRIGFHPYVIADTGGLGAVSTGLEALVSRHAWRTAQEGGCPQRTERS
jgi:GTP-binding protein